MSSIVGAGAGDPQEVQNINTDPEATLIIPPKKRAILEEIISKYEQVLLPNEMESIIIDYYAANPKQNQVGIIYEEIEQRVLTKIDTWEPDDRYWTSVAELIGQKKLEELKFKYNFYKKSSDEKQQADYKALHNILRKFKVKTGSLYGDINTVFNDYLLEKLLQDINAAKIKANKQFGGKKKTRGKGKRKSQARRKSGKSRKGKGRK